MRPQSNNRSVRSAQRSDRNQRDRRQRQSVMQRSQPRRIDRTISQPQRNNRTRWENVQRTGNAGREREQRRSQVRWNRSDRDRRSRDNNRSYRSERRPQIIIPQQKRHPERYRTERRSNLWENAVWRNNSNRERRQNYYAPIRNNSRGRRDRNRYERRSNRYYGWPSRVSSQRHWGTHNRNRNMLASFYRMEQRNRWKALKREQKQREKYWRQVRKNERRYQRYMARVYRDRYYSQPYAAYYQPYTTVRYGYVTRPRRVYYPSMYTVYNSYPSNYYYADNNYDPYYQQSYYDPYYYDDDDGIDWTSIILQTALSAFLPDSGFDSIVPVNNYVYEPSYGYAPANYSYAAERPVYSSYSPTVYPAAMVENAYQRGYQEGFEAGRNSAYYNDPYVMQNGSYYPYSVSLSRDRELLSQGYERGYTDAMNGTGEYYYDDDGYTGGGDLVGIMLDNVLSLS
jgi:hypothetical protein